MTYEMIARYWSQEPDVETLAEDEIEVPHTGGKDCECLLCLAYGPLIEQD